MKPTLFILLLLIGGVCMVGCKVQHEKYNPNWIHERYLDSPQLIVLMPCDYCRLMGLNGIVIDSMAYNKNGHPMLVGWLKKARIVSITSLKK